MHSIPSVCGLAEVVWKARARRRRSRLRNAKIHPQDKRARQTKETHANLRNALLKRFGKPDSTRREANTHRTNERTNAALKRRAAASRGRAWKKTNDDRRTEQSRADSLTPCLLVGSFAGSAGRRFTRRCIVKGIRMHGMVRPVGTHSDRGCRRRPHRRMSVG